MEHEKIVPSMGKEMNFFDLCIAAGRAIGRVCIAFWHLMERMIRLTYRLWWIVIPVLALAICAAFYQTRKANITYRVNAIAMINGASMQQFDQAFTPLRSGKMLPLESPIESFIEAHTISNLDIFPVIDCLHDGTADYVDFKRKENPLDTIKVKMKDRICIQFLIKNANIEAIPVIEHALLDYLNHNPALQQSYVTYLHNLRDEAAFNHRQAIKLDSLTSRYYFDFPSQHQPETTVHSGVNFYGEHKIHLFLPEIYKQRERMQQIDYRLQLATAPITLENHFALDPKPVFGRYKALMLYGLFGWILGCLIALIIDKRKALSAWLKA